MRWSSDHRVYSSNARSCPCLPVRTFTVRPFTFVFATPAYVAISFAITVGRRPPRAEWAWKTAGLVLCLIFFFGSGLLSYYLGTIATSGRTPTSAVAWDKILSFRAWLQLFENHSLCQEDSRLLLCVQDRGAWLNIAALRRTTPQTTSSLGSTGLVHRRLWPSIDRLLAAAMVRRRFRWASTRRRHPTVIRTPAPL
jgi:hypothetical protein